jgi:shikimate kinase
MKIVLLGYMGSGKSTVAKLVASHMNLQFIDLDNYIAEQEKMSIPILFESRGEIYFRLRESEYLNDLLHEEKDLVLALGGGTPCYANNMDLIKNSSESIYLKASIPTLVERLRREKDQRPLIASFDDEKLEEFVAKHLFERRNFYDQATYSVSIDGKKVEEIVTEILTKVK